MEYKKITSYQVNSKNPFLNESFEVAVTNKRKVFGGKKSSIIVNNETGEVEGHQVFAVVEKVDKATFTKLYPNALKALFGLSNRGVRVFSFIASVAKPNKGEILFDIDDCKEYTKYKSHQPVLSGLAELIEYKFIARTDKHYKYYINPMMFFNGNRLTLIKTWEVDNNIKMSNDPNQIKGQTMLDI